MHSYSINAMIAISMYLSILLFLYSIFKKYLHKNKYIALIFISLASQIAINIHSKFTNKCSTEHINAPVLLDECYHFSTHGIGGWSLGHLVMGILLGYFYPKCGYLFMFTGILWELIEFNAFNHVQQESRDDRYQYRINWTGNPWDIFFNDAGFLVGFALQFLVKFFQRA
jgi:hypothetical protein